MFFAPAVMLFAQVQLVDIRNLEPREHREQAFVLSAPATLAIEAVGAEPRREACRRCNKDDEWWGNDEEKDTWPAAAWIIDARTREVVWDIRTATTERDRSGVRRFSGTARLPAGTYIAHYGSYVATIISMNSEGTLASLLRSVSRRRDITYGGPYVDDGSYREFRFVVRGEGRPASVADTAQAERAYTANAFVVLRPDTAGFSERRAFELPRAMDVEVTGSGEITRDEAFDYGWIQNADTRQRVWTMDQAHTDAAGGAHKNRLVRQTLHLAAGRYVAYYVTDDSHDPFDWNNVPPYDPANYGLTIRTSDAAAGAIRTFAWEPVPAGQTIVQLIGIGDREARSEGFTLTRPMDVRIYAIGEGSNPDAASMDDYAWITDATTRRRVWTMRYDDTQHAGGAQKNRLFDGIVHLAAGSYVVHYMSDDSHSYRHWNDAAPAEARYYGVSVFPASGTLDRSALGRFESPATNAIAQLVQMRDDIRARRSFTLDREQRVRVYAIGEGVDGEMYDYGWIENTDSGRTVWEMTYRGTTRAGGASKNRLADTTITLPAGHYVLRWESDGSHSFGDWNDDPPDDPEMWGISLLRVP